MSQDGGGIYKEIEKALRAANTPLTCNELYDMSSIKQYARHPNKVSDTLGAMWRRGYLSRTPAPIERGSQAKWAYVWGAQAAKQAPKPAAPAPRMKGWAKPRVEVEEATGAVTVELDSIVVTVRPK